MTHVTHLLLRLAQFGVDHVKLAVAAALGALALAVFIRWEREGRGIRTVFTIAGALLVDATLYPSTAAMQLVGAFHPFFGGQSFRLVQLLIGLGLVARLVVRGLPKRVDAATVLWSVFFLWYVVAAVNGLLLHHDRHLVIARAFFVLETGGLALLVAGVPARDYLDSRGLPRFLYFAGALAGVNFVLAEAHVRITASLPQLPLLDFGELGADAATLFPAFGFIGLAMELTRERRRVTVLVASVLLVLAPLASTQRAARLGIAVTVVAFLAIVVWPRRRRFHARGGDWVVVAMCAAAIVAAPIFARSVAGERPPSLVAAIPFSKNTAQAVSTDYRQGSVQSRYNEWRAAEPLIRNRPIVGNGLGATFTHYEVGTNETVTYDLTNNIPLDLLLRTGLIGLLLFAAAVAATLSGAWQVWRRARSDVASLVAAMTAAVLIGFLGKGMVESVLNEYHMTPLLGILLGLVAALHADFRGSAAGAT